MTWTTAGTARVTAKMTSAGGEAVQNVFDLMRTGGPTGNTEATDAIGEWLEYAYGAMAGFISENVTFAGFSVLLTATSEALGDNVWPTFTVGGGTGDQLPAANAVLGLFRTGISKHVGRKYLGPFSETDHADGLWGGSLLSVVGDAMIRMSTSYVAGNGVSFIPVIVDRLTGERRPTVSLSVNAQVRSQRRRNRGIGI